MKKLSIAVLILLSAVMLMSCESVLIAYKKPSHQPNTVWEADEHDISFTVTDEGTMGEMIINGERIDIFISDTHGAELEIYSLYDRIKSGCYKPEFRYGVWECTYITKKVFVAKVKEGTYLDVGEKITFRRTEVLSSENENDSDGVTVQVPPQDASCIELVSRTYDRYELMDIIKTQKPLDKMNELYPTECLRKTEYGYRNVYFSDDSVAVILFDSLGNRTSGKIYACRLLKSDFDGLEEGQPLEKVMEIDSDEEYLFRYMGEGDSRFSYHYTKDGYLITIEYDVSNTIINIEEELI